MSSNGLESQYISENELMSMVEKYNHLQIKNLNIPKEFTNNLTINPNEVKYAFDPNVFFSVFDQIKLMRNYILDYIYLYDHHGGEPYLYARSMSEKPIDKREDYFHRFSIDPPQMLLGALPSSHARRPYLEHVVFENSFFGFFQFSLFCFLVDRFYRNWHSCYNEMTFLLTRSGLEKYLLSNIGSMGEENVNRMLNINHQPLVVLNGNKGKVRMTYHDPIGGGLYFLYAHVEWPNNFVDFSTETLIKGSPYLF